MGMKWEDVDFQRSRIHIRRALVRDQLTTPKSGKDRFVVMAPQLADLLRELITIRKREQLKFRWNGMPAWVFPSRAGTHYYEGNVERVWNRVRDLAAAEGVRRLTLHSARHTWVSLALHSGKSIKWIAAQVGHADPALTLRVYAHLMPDVEEDLSFLEFYPIMDRKGHGSCDDVPEISR